jgi:dCTP deaminase
MKKLLMKAFSLINDIKTLRSHIDFFYDVIEISKGLHCRVLNDIEITELCTGDRPMISPFISESVKTASKCIDLSQERRNYKILSKGLSSAGYDISASAEDVKIFKHIPGEVVDPKNFNPHFLEDANIKTDETGIYFIIPGNSYALLKSEQRFDLPRNIKGRCDGKSTNARVGIHVNITPLEPGWSGVLTIEISNNSPSDCRVYLEEGIAQLEFVRINNPLVSYADRSGKYNNQENKVVFAKV